LKWKKFVNEPSIEITRERSAEEHQISSHRGDGVASDLKPRFLLILYTTKPLHCVWFG
jgi:hypothetical protein